MKGCRERERERETYVIFVTVPLPQSEMVCNALCRGGVNEVQCYRGPAVQLHFQLPDAAFCLI